jgi:TetR/AcrR family transcriptional regulator
MADKLEKEFERKEELVEAALDEFTRNNYKNASLNTIIKQAAVSKGSFYYHFKNKESLYTYLLKHAFTQKWEFIQEKNHQKPGLLEGKDFFERIKIQARLAAEFANAFPKYQRLSSMFIVEKGNAIHEIVLKELKSGSENIMHEMIRSAMAEGSLRRDFPENFIQNVLDYLLTHYDQIFDAPEDSELEKMLTNLDYLMEFIQHGFGTQKEN